MSENIQNSGNVPESQPISHEVSEIHESAPEVTSEQVTEEAENPEITLAKSKGWLPKDQYKGDPDNYKGYKAYIKDGEIIEQLKMSKTALKELEHQMKALAKQQEEREKARIDAEASFHQQQLDLAKKNNDINAYETHRNALDNLRGVGYTVPKNSHQLHVDEFVERNKDWYNESSVKSRAMKSFAISLENDLATKPEFSDVEKRLKHVEEETKKAFSSEIAATTPVSKVAAVAPAGSSAGHKSDPISGKFTPEQKKIFEAMKALVPSYTPEQYAKALAARR